MQDTKACGLDGELTLDMLDPRTRTSILAGETIRAFEHMDHGRVAELLAAVQAAEFFTRPEPVVGTEPGTCLWRIGIEHQGRSRELVISDKNAEPELERLARAARACLRDRQVFKTNAMPDEMRHAIAMSLRDDDARQIFLDMDAWSKMRLSELTNLTNSDPRMAAFYADIADDNVKIRLRFLSTFPSLTAVTLADVGMLAPAETKSLDHWLAERRVFAVPVGPEKRFPVFQFAQGQPLPVVADVLAALPANRSAWQTAFWFVSSNRWFDGATPLSLIETAPESVVAAARHESDEVVG
jgi:hypothetical protein